MGKNARQKRQTRVKRSKAQKREAKLKLAKPPPPREFGGNKLTPGEFMQSQALISILGALLPGMMPDPRLGLAVMARYLGAMCASTGVTRDEVLKVWDEAYDGRKRLIEAQKAAAEKQKADAEAAAKAKPELKVVETPPPAAPEPGAPPASA